MKIAHQQGSVLVEILIASVILTVAIFALSSFHASLYRSHSITGQQDIAFELAHSQLQTFRNYTQLTSTTGQFAYADITANTVGTTSSVAGATYTMTWTVTDSTSPTRKTVRITVTWNDSTGTARTLNADSIIASIDPKLTAQVSQGLP